MKRLMTAIDVESHLRGRLSMRKGSVVALAACLLTLSTASVGLAESPWGTADQIKVSFTRTDSNTVEFAYTSLDGEDCGFNVLYISKVDPGSGGGGSEVVVSFSPVMPLDLLIAALDQGQWVAFNTVSCGSNGGDFGAAALAAKLAHLEIGEGFSFNAATFSF